MVCPCGSNTDFFKVTNTRARMRLHLDLNGGRSAAPGARILAEHPVENMIDISELLVQIERAFDLGGWKDVRDVRIRQQELLEVRLLMERTHRIALDPLVRLLARSACPREFQQHRT